MSDSKTVNGRSGDGLSTSLSKALLGAILDERSEREQAALNALHDESDSAHPYTHASLMGDVRQLHVFEAVIRRASNIGGNESPASGRTSPSPCSALFVPDTHRAAFDRFVAAGQRAISHELEWTPELRDVSAALDGGYWWAKPNKQEKTTRRTNEIEDTAS